MYATFHNFIFSESQSLKKSNFGNTRYTNLIRVGLLVSQARIFQQVDQQFQSLIAEMSEHLVLQGGKYWRQVRDYFSAFLSDPNEDDATVFLASNTLSQFSIAKPVHQSGDIRIAC